QAQFDPVLLRGHDRGIRRKARGPAFEFIHVPAVEWMMIRKLAEGPDIGPETAEGLAKGVRVTDATERPNRLSAERFRRGPAVSVRQFHRGVNGASDGQVRSE